MILICMISFLNSILTGLIANAIFTLVLIYLIQRIRYWYYLRRKFHEKSFNTYWKRYPNEVVHKVNCKVKGNTIYFQGEVNSRDDNFEGQFIINPINLKTGEGFHTHENSEGFAFARIIIKDDTSFLLEAPVSCYT
jgi:hypothetical protein